MAETKKTTAKKRTVAKKKTVKSVAEEKPILKAELETGDVILADDVDEPEKNDTVTVCSNFPRDIKFRVLDNRGQEQTILIKGNASNLRGLGSGILPIGAYGITANVPKGAWEQIATVFKDDARFKNGLIFATSSKNARSEAKERKDLRNGYEPIDAKKSVKTKPND